MEFDFGSLLYLLALLWPLLSRLLKRREAQAAEPEPSADEAEDWRSEQTPLPEEAIPERAGGWQGGSAGSPRGTPRESPFTPSDPELPSAQTYSGSYPVEVERDEWQPAESAAWDAAPWEADSAAWDERAPEEPKLTFEGRGSVEASAKIERDEWEDPLDDSAWMLRLERAKRRPVDAPAGLAGRRAVRGVAVHAAHHEERERASVAAPWTARGVAHRAGARVLRAAHRGEIRDAILLATVWSPSVVRRRPSPPPRAR